MHMGGERIEITGITRLKAESCEGLAVALRMREVLQQRTCFRDVIPLEMCMDELSCKKG